MRKILTFVLPVALAICTFGLQDSALAETGAASPAKAEMPDVKVGDQWKFECSYGRQKFEFLRAVTSVDQSGIKATEGRQQVVMTRDLNFLESSQRKNSDQRRLSFPLEVGKQWSAHSNWVDYAENNANGDEKISVTVVGYEKVRVFAGEFDAFKLKYKSSWTDITNHGNGTSDWTYWYAPAARAIVKSDLFYTYNPEFVCELLELKLQP